MDLKPGEQHEHFTPARKQTFLSKVKKDGGNTVSF
jgi:hypothetical protein